MTYIDIPVRVPRAEGVSLVFSAGLDPRARHSDGVTFRLSVDGDELWARHGTWSCFAERPERLDLNAYAGRDVTLRLSVDPGPARNSSFDWAFWTRLDLVADEGGVTDLLGLDYTAGCVLDNGAPPIVLGQGFLGTAPDTGAAVERRVPVWDLHTVTLADPVGVADVVLSGHERATQVYNLSACGGGSRIRNCVFLPQRRHALLLRAPGCAFTGNVVREVGGSGVWLGNEIGQFNEGPLPFATVIRDNLFHGTRNRSVFAQVSCHDRPCERLITGLEIEENVFIGARMNAVEIHDVEGARVQGNIVRVAGDTPLDQRALFVENGAGVVVEGLRLRDRRGALSGAVRILGSGEGVAVRDIDADLAAGVPLLTHE
jgi:hypothetical protein